MIILFENEVNELKRLIDSHNNIVFFGGAGVSTESNIPDFRSSNGLFNQKLNRRFSPEEVVSYSFFVRYQSISMNSTKISLFIRTQSLTMHIRHSLI